MTPFGRPVVPDVYISRWMSSPSTCARAGRRRLGAADRRTAPTRRRPLGRDAHADEVASSPARSLRSASSTQRVVAHERARFGVLEDEPQLRRREPPVDRHRDRAEMVGGEDRREELDAVVREQPDDVAGADAACVQPARQRRGPVRHRPVGDDLVAEDGDRLVRRAARVVLEHTEPAHVRMHPSSRPLRRRVAAVDHDRRPGRPARRVAREVRVRADEVGGSSRARADAWPRSRRSPPAGGRRGCPRGTCPGTRS